MTYRIHFTWPSGEADYIDISGADVDDIRDQAHEAMEARGVDTSTCWSEALT